MRRMFHFATAFCFLGVCSCNKPPTIPDEVAETSFTSENVNAEQVSRENNVDQAADSPDNVLELVKAFSQRAMPSAEFEIGYAEPIASSELTLESSDQGYVVTFPSGSPIATPTIMGNRVVCTSIRDAREIWGHTLEGDLKKLGGHLASPPVTFEDHVYVATAKGDILQFHRDTGHSERLHQLEASFRFRPIVTRDAILVTSQDGRLFYLKRNGKW